MNRKQWKVAYRAMRVHRRESIFDGFVYGMGFMRFQHDKDPEHLDVQSVLKKNLH